MTHEFDLASTDGLLTTTRTVRKRLDLTREVEPEVLMECLRIAIQAPSGSNAQGWRWVVVRDPTLKATLADEYREASQRYLDAAEVASAESSGLVSSAKYLVEILADVPAIVIPCLLGTPQAAGRVFRSLGYEIGEWSNFVAAGFYGSIWPAVWSLMLALRSRGIGSALTTLHLAREREVADLLDIPESVTQVGMLPVAYFKGKTFKPAKRRPAEEVVYWDRWKAVGVSPPFVEGP